MKILETLKNFIENFPFSSLQIEGVPLQIFENPGSPTMSMVFSFSDGVAYEPAHLGGVSHFVEHILFRGTEQFPSLYDISRRVEGIGGQISAYSTRDMTAFWIKTLRGCEKEALTVMEELLTKPLLKNEYIEAERAIIYQERQRELNNPPLYSSLLMESLLLLPDPISRHPVGKDEVIGKINQEILKTYLQDFYHKKNMGIAVSGNIGDEFVKDLKGMVRNFPDGKIQKKADFVTDVPEGHVFILPSHLKTQVYLSLGWKFPVKNRQEMFTWRIINTLLGAGYTSLFNRTLREQENITYLCTTRFNTYDEKGIFKINMALTDENIMRAVTLIDGLIDDIKKKNIPQDIFNEAIIRHASHVVTRMEDTLEIAKLMGQSLTREKTEFTFKEYLEQIERVNLSEASGLVEKYLIPENRKILLHTGSEIPLKIFPEAVKLERSKDGEAIVWGLDFGNT